MADIKPIGAWDGDGPVAGVAWWSKLDGRYHVEVQYDAEGDGYRGTLAVFDHNDGDKLIFSEPTGIQYAARFGADVDDVDRWEERVIEVIDQRASLN